MSDNSDFSDEEPTQPTIHETLAQFSAQIRAAQKGMPEPIATSERPTKNIRPMRSQNITVILP